MGPALTVPVRVIFSSLLLSPGRTAYQCVKTKTNDKHVIVTPLTQDAQEDYAVLHENHRTHLAVMAEPKSIHYQKQLLSHVVTDPYIYKSSRGSTT